MRIGNSGYKERWMSGFFTVCKDVRVSDINYWESRKKSEKGLFYTYQNGRYLLNMSYLLEPVGYKKEGDMKILFEVEGSIEKRKRAAFGEKTPSGLFSPLHWRYIVDILRIIFWA